jgi:hypothetical protein
MATQTKIKSITVENVRGISSKKFVFDVPEMIGNKFHILVAPNGFGKSSLAGAFDSLKPKSLKLPDSLFHKNNGTHKPQIQIDYTIDGASYAAVADESKNDISKEFSIAVINSKLKPKASSQGKFMPHARPTAKVILEPVILAAKIPSKPEKVLKSSELKTWFGVNGKVLPVIERFLEIAGLLDAVLSCPNISKFTQKTVWKEIDIIRDEINRQYGTSDQIKNWIESCRLTELRSIAELLEIAQLFRCFDDLSETERFLMAMQFGRFCGTEIKVLRQYRDRQCYLRHKERCVDLLHDVNSNPTWIQISITETKGKLMIVFPPAQNMSNGQRDLLSFVAQLMKAEFELNGARSILVVDEIFDYLDESNLVAAQFYVSRFIQGFKSRGIEIFPLFLTHLEPSIFKHAALGIAGMDRVHVLDKANDVSRTRGIALMVRDREDPDVKDYIGKFFFHYHPSVCDQSALFVSRGWKKSWGNSQEFYKYAWEELRKYCSGDSDLDYVAACVGLRVAIEKLAFDSLSTVEQKTRFTEEFKKNTPCKLDFVESVGVIVPISHRLLGILYSDMLHFKPNFDYISAIISKMKNPAIRGMVKSIPIPT